ncbi:uncharacterized protein LOC105700070 isoform X2 [Orussus abietinus]|uniref:uncharacterized protein LOC105700070 isoform X2 n=1 Tax=Orussus abietinus TaxID=222816 RepID=UPI0006265FA6|nr:uncharacterized protein LOC105700070 isoform X2 [Orussus abietinus]
MSDDTDDDIRRSENLPEDSKPGLSRRQEFEEWAEEKYGSEEEDIQEEEELELFLYDSQKYISGPRQVENGTMPIDFLEFHHSYAYDCRKYFNLCVADPNTLIFASGNLIHFFNVIEGTVWFRRCSTGGGIGHIVKNPMLNHIAVGENGVNPPIIIYEWPSMEIVTILRNGTTRSYSHLAYRPDGLLMVSQGGDPDYLITVWNWKKSQITLRCKSYGQDIFNVTFSPTVSGHLTSSGTGHIKFWKMARTFTGLKLQGELGRFGKTEISDIIGVYPMPDEKVVSGCEWGNILVWDEGLIKVEVCKKNRKPCHMKYISQFEYNNEELMSVGMDGWIRIWFYETIDQADPPDDDRFVEVEPVYEFHITEDTENDDDRQSSMLMCIQKQKPEDPEETLWYAQDANGGLWLIDLCTLQTPEAPKKILTCHAGPITDMDVADWGPFVATCGTDGRLHIYNYFEKKLILVHYFHDVGNKVVWFPTTVEATGSIIVCAFASGIIRVITAAVLEANISNEVKGDYVRLIQVLKPHLSTVTAMSLNASHSLLVTGSDDETIFTFHIKRTKTYPILEPIGYVKVPSGVTCMTWKPKHETTILIGCSRGDCMEVELPHIPQEYTTVTYELVRCEPRFFKFKSVKSFIRREQIRSALEAKKEAKITRKRDQMERLRIDNPGIEIDEEAFLMDSEEDPPLPEIYIPKVPNQVLMVHYMVDGTVWLSMSGFDSGYIYEYPDPLPGKFEEEPIKSTVVFEADDTEIRSCLFYEEYLILGMEHGEIRVCRVNPNDHTDFSDYWILPMHDNYNGYIPTMKLSHDHKMLLTCGHDGNLFSFKINYTRLSGSHSIPQAKSPLPLPTASVEDIEDPSEYPSLEEVIVRVEHDRIMAAAKQKKDQTLDVLRGLVEEYGKLVERNRGLLKSQQIPQEEFELDPRITADLNQQLAAEMNFVHRKLAFRVEKSKLGLQKLLDHFIKPITCLPFAVRRILRPDAVVWSLRERKLDDDFHTIYKDIIRRIEEKNKADQVADVKSIENIEEDGEHLKIQGIESFLKGLSPSTIQYRLGVQINQLLRKYRARKARLEERNREWKAMYASKPDPHVNHPDDVLAIAEAKRTIGDYKLKLSSNFSAPPEKRESTLTKYKQLLDCRRKAHHLREDFNNKLRNVRNKKQRLQQEVMGLVATLKTIHSEIPQKKVKPLPSIPTFDYNTEFPERNLELEKYTSMAERVKEAKRKKQSIVIEDAVQHLDEEYEILLLDEKVLRAEHEATQAEELSTLVAVPEKIYKVQIMVPSEIMQNLASNDRMETSWEREMKRARVMRKIHEQDCILKHIQNSYEDLDEELDELERERLEIVADSVYMDLFLLTLHQEFIVLKDFETMENLLTDKVNEKLKEQADVKKKILAINSMIEGKNREILKTQEKIKDLVAQFMSMINENKFHDFLKRIFKKKFKAPKTDDDTSESSESSTSESSSEDVDAGSIDSRDIGPLQIDENVCPVGCEKELYDAAFSMREERYEFERLIKENQTINESLRKEAESHAKKLRIIEMNLRSNRENLEAYMREKQQKLNDIDMTVILKFHQLQHFIDSEKLADINNCVLFDKTKLNDLYSRVGELERETEEQKAKHKKNRHHLHRMKVDCKHMEEVIKKLKSNIKEEMIRKFGQELSLSTLYEAVLQRMIYETKVNLNSMMKSYDDQIKCVKKKYAEQVDTLKDLIQDNTEKLCFLTVLEEEQIKLQKILRRAPITEEDIQRIETTYRDDLTRLENILRSQMHQKELFQNDIRNLSLKSKPLPPICMNDKRRRRIDNINDTRFTIIDVTTENEYGTDNADFEDDTYSRMEEVEDYRKDEVMEEGSRYTHSELFNDTTIATMVRNLLSRIIEVSVEDETMLLETKEMLHSVISNLSLQGSEEELYADIERGVDDIMSILSQNDKDDAAETREIIRESLHNIISRLSKETHKTHQENDSIQDLKRELNELLRSIGSEMEAEVIDNTLELLELNDADAAIEYFDSCLPQDINEETKTTVKERLMNLFRKTKHEATEVIPVLEGIEQIDEEAQEYNPTSEQTQETN